MGRNQWPIKSSPPRYDAHSPNALAGHLHERNRRERVDSNRRRETCLIGKRRVSLDQPAGKVSTGTAESAGQGACMHKMRWRRVGSIDVGGSRLIAK